MYFQNFSSTFIRVAGTDELDEHTGNKLAHGVFLASLHGTICLDDRAIAPIRDDFVPGACTSQSVARVGVAMALLRQL